MKKKLSLIMALVFVMLAFAGCGKNESKAPEKTNTPETTQNAPQSEEKETKTEEAESEKQVEKEYLFGGKYSVLILEDRLNEGSLCGVRFYLPSCESAILAQSPYEEKEEFTGGVKDVFDYLNDKYIVKSIGTRNIGYYEATDKPLNKISSESVKVKAKNFETDAEKVKSILTSTKGKECFSYGYFMMLDEKPVAIVGFLFTDEQKESDKTALIEEIDNLVESLEKR